MFKPDSIILNSVYSQAKYLKDKSDNNHRRQKKFIENINRGTLDSGNICSKNN